MITMQTGLPGQGGSSHGCCSSPVGAGKTARLLRPFSEQVLLRCFDCGDRPQRGQQEPAFLREAFPALNWERSNAGRPCQLTPVQAQTVRGMWLERCGGNRKARRRTRSKQKGGQPVGANRLIFLRVPNRIRTGVVGVKGRSPVPNLLKSCVSASQQMP